MRAQHFNPVLDGHVVASSCCWTAIIYHALQLCPTAASKKHTIVRSALRGLSPPPSSLLYNTAHFRLQSAHERRCGAHRTGSMGGKAKPTKHTAKEIAGRIAASTQNKGGGKAGLADRKGGNAVRVLPRYQAYLGARLRGWRPYTACRGAVVQGRRTRRLAVGY